ncbi:MAG: DNA pilot protein [Microviridae sp.]|nr:MAG: DNA pilot protein [Microviridae sp.]
MPLPVISPLVTAGIEAGSSLLGGLFNKFFGNQQHAQSIDDWNMQNAYNSPKAQMGRLKDAGLNPNLVYGQLQNGNAPQVPQQAPSKVNLEGIYSQAISLANQNKQIEQTVENLKTNQQLMQANIELSKANTELRGSQGADLQSRISNRDILTPYQVQLSKSNIAKADADVMLKGISGKFQLDENERRQALTQSNLARSLETILNMRRDRARTDADILRIQQQTKNMVSQKELFDLDIALQKKGIQKSDPAYMRILTRAINGASFPELKAEIDSLGFMGAKLSNMYK